MALANYNDGQISHSLEGPINSIRMELLREGIEDYEYFWLLQELVKNGIFMSPGVSFLSYSHSLDDIENTLKIFDEISTKILDIKDENYEKYLEGNIPKKVWTMNIPSTKRLSSNSKKQ